MPRDQEASLRHDPATGDDPLFRDRSGPARPDQDEYATTGSSPNGDDVAATRRDGSAVGDATDPPGEWVAGSKGPDYAPVDNTTDPAGTGATPDLRATRDPDVAPETALSADPNATREPDATRDSGSTWGPSATQTFSAGQGTDVAQDADLTRDTEVTPGSEATPPSGIPVASSADASSAGATAADVPQQTPTATSTPADAANTTTPAGTAAPAAADPSATAPGTPVPGAPGTAPTTGVDAAVAAFVTNGEELHAEWVRIQSSFVDDPRGSVSQAADLVSQVTSSLIAAVQEREQAMRGVWDTQGGGDADTEHLRNAFRDYRAFFERLAQL